MNHDELTIFHLQVRIGDTLIELFVNPFFTHESGSRCQMSRLALCLLFSTLFVLSGGLVGQEPKKDDPPVKAKGVLPPNWKKIGLSDDQVQTIYKIQGKYNEEIDKLEAKIKELKGTKDKEMKAVLSADQKKKLEELLVGKDK